MTKNSPRTLLDLLDLASSSFGSKEPSSELAELREDTPALPLLVFLLCYTIKHVEDEGGLPGKDAGFGKMVENLGNMDIKIFQFHIK